MNFLVARCRHLRPSMVLVFTSLALALGSAHELRAQHAFVHIADDANSFLNVTQLDDPVVNGDASARLIVTPHWNPGATLLGVSNPHYIGVFHSSGRWNIFNEDLALMPDGAGFNVLVAPADRSYVHEATVGNTGGPQTVLDDPLIVEASDTQFFVTHNRTPDGESFGPFLDEPMRSLFFFDPGATWSIEVDLSGSIAVGTEFNVFAPEASFRTFDHRTGASNISFDLTRLDHPELNDNPTALVWAYEHVPIGPATDNDHPFAVAYDVFTERWVILNSDGADFANDVRFVVGYLGGLIFRGDFEDESLIGWSSAVGG